jgi:hypothetical protein
VVSDARSVPADGSVYPIEKCSSPARILGRKNCFCASEPYSMIVRPTVLIVRNGIGALARQASLKKMNCSTSVRPWPPYSVGQPIPSQPSRPILRTASRQAGPPVSPAATSASTSGVMRSVKYARMSVRNASCSGVYASSTTGFYHRI